MQYFNEKKSLQETLAKYLIIYPVLLILGLFDLFISLIIPCKYQDKRLPKKDAILTKQSNQTDPNSAYRSTMPCEFFVEDSDNIYDEFVKSVNKFANFNTLGVRYVIVAKLIF